MPDKVRASWEPTAQRQRSCKNRYGENAAGKWVRASAFREIDCDPENPDRLREFSNFDAAFAFDEECRLNGTGGRKAVHMPKPKDTVPKEQLALEKAIKQNKDDFKKKATSTHRRLSKKTKPSPDKRSTKKLRVPVAITAMHMPT